MKAKEILNKYNITRDTLCRWVKEGKIDYEILPSGRYDYLNKTIDQPKYRKTVIYSRCSTSNQKDNLERQIDRLKSFCCAKGYVIDDIYSEIASALNYNRKEYRKLYNNIINGEIERVVIEYKDRLLRVGFDDFNHLCDIFNTELIVLDNSENKSQSQEIVDDMIAIIHHFSSKLYSKRKRKKIITTIKEEELSPV